MPVRDDPAAVLTRLLHAIDDVDWGEVRACLADEVRTDYTELFGGEAETLPADELVERWKGLVPGFDATQHMTGPCLVDERDGGLVAQTHVRAYHRIGDAVWGVHGHYVVPLERTSAGWQIAGITLRLFYQEGDRDLPARAAERAGTSPRVTRRTTEARAGA
ncbi:SnoaL-like protein [Pseudonocardia hierapolitana]|uniref:SnoaL-like protein n=1 Tax=Pseudonocardia hierapolitana TaxID=1128676 RepID=A0A561T3J8_9PSEU|nr:nuclear transport factor 2 family protein [Pseudonocardia hierapolitana]TWF81691.1 SnoaL-like protein [Pseudonocardia hierapolitana]